LKIGQHEVAGKILVAYFLTQFIIRVFYLLNKCSAVAEMDNRLGTIDMGRKEEGVLLCPFRRGGAGPHLTKCRLAKVYFPTKSHLGLSNRVAITDMG